MIIRNFHTGPLAVNSYVVTDETTGKTFIVDPGGHNTQMVNHIKENNLELDYIILTHGHGDHLGGVPDMKREFPDAKLVACIHDRALVEDPRLNMSSMVLDIRFPLIRIYMKTTGTC
jgi:glyoxylase-like metal-dependent hydrolase (beta-lactamase superfamily II)